MLTGETAQILVAYVPSYQNSSMLPKKTKHIIRDTRFKKKKKKAQFRFIIHFLKIMNKRKEKKIS